MLLSCQGGRSEEKDRLRGRAGHVTAEAALELKLKRGDRKMKREEVEKESCAGALPANVRLIYPTPLLSTSSPSFLDYICALQAPNGSLMGPYDSSLPPKRLDDFQSSVLPKSTYAFPLL